MLTALAKLPGQLAAEPAAAADARNRTVTYFTKRLAQVDYAAFQAAGVTLLDVIPIGPDPLGDVAKVKEWVS